MFLRKGNNAYVVKIFAPLFVLYICLTVSGCTKNYSTESTTVPPPQTLDSMSYQFNAFGIQSMRTGEFMALWVKITPDTAWRFVSILTLRYRYPDDSVLLVGKFYNNKPIDSLKDVIITLEQTTKPQTPGLLLAHARVFLLDSAKTHMSISLDARPVLGDFSLLQGSLVFTSPLPDTTAYTHELYLMNFQGSQQTPSLLSLNQLPAGWKYGVWAVDTNFTPHESFFYGLFTSPQGHDNDSANDHYPYPGGWKPQRMDVAGGSIIVTLEPEFYGDSLKFKAPSPFILLEFKRIRNILKNNNYPMKNVSVNTIPSGIITFRKD
ncbi:MAG: hypothetical protein ACHQM6_07440 [Candidatus Kapaibacterium sp.]